MLSQSLTSKNRSFRYHLSSLGLARCAPPVRLPGALPRRRAVFIPFPSSSGYIEASRHVGGARRPSPGPLEFAPPATRGATRFVGRIVICFHYIRETESVNRERDSGGVS